MGMCSPFNTLFFGGAGLCVTRQNPSNANPIRKASWDRTSQGLQVVEHGLLENPPVIDDI